MHQNFSEESAEGATIEEILLSKKDSRQNYEVPVKLITYPDGSMDLFRQDGDDFDEHVQEAARILMRRGLIVGTNGAIFKTGIYLPVAKREIHIFPVAKAKRDPRLAESSKRFEGNDSLVRMAFSDAANRTLPEHVIPVKLR